MPAPLRRYIPWNSAARFQSRCRSAAVSKPGITFPIHDIRYRSRVISVQISLALNFFCGRGIASAVMNFVPATQLFPHFGHKGVR